MRRHDARLITRSTFLLTLLLPSVAGDAALGQAKPADGQRPIPTSTADAVAVVDIGGLPRINPTNVFDESPTQVNYLAKAGINSADVFYRETLEGEGWKPAGTEDRATAEYVDRLFHKAGYYVRLTIGASGEKGVVSVGVMNLGNVDVRKLPRPENAELNTGSGPVNATFATKLSLADAAKYCQQQLVAQGWKEFKDPSAPDIDVPHVKMVYFRQNDARVQAVIYRDPNKVDEGPTSVSWLSMPVATDAPKAKPNAADLAQGNVVRPPAKTTKPSAPSKPAKPAADDDDDNPVPTTPAADLDDFADKLQKEIEAKVNKQLEKLGKTLDDIPGAKVPGKGAAGKSAKKPTKPAVPRDDDDEPEAKPAKTAPAELFLTGTCRGVLKYDGKDYELKHAIGIRYFDREQQVTMVFCGGAPLKAEKLKRGKPADISLFDVTGFDAPPSLSLRFTDSSKSFTAFVGGASINVSSTKIKSDVAVKDDHLAGTTNLPEPEEFFKKEFQFEVTVDLTRAANASAADKSDSDDELVASDEFGLPIPEDHFDWSSEKSPYRHVVRTRVAAGLDKLVKFYRKQLPQRDYQENTKAAKIAKASADMTFRGEDGDLVVSLKADEDQTQIELVKRNATLATEHGIVAKNGMSRIMLGNASESPVTVTIDGKPYKLAAGVGADKPQNALKVDLKPGKHTVIVKIGDEDPETEELDIPSGATWGIIATGPGYLAERMF